MPMVPKKLRLAVCPVRLPLEEVQQDLNQLWFDLFMVSVRLRNILGSTMAPARPAKPKPRNKKKRIVKRIGRRTA